MDRGTLNAITMSKKTRESLTEKIPVGQREIKEETGAEVGRCRGGNGS